MCQFSGIFFINLPLSASSCRFIQFMVGLSPTLMFSAILVKSRIVYHIFIRKFNSIMVNEDETSSNGFVCPAIPDHVFEKMLMPGAHIITILGMIFIQFIIITIWTFHQVKPIILIWAATLYFTQFFVKLKELHNSCTEPYLFKQISDSVITIKKIKLRVAKKEKIIYCWSYFRPHAMFRFATSTSTKFSLCRSLI